MIRLVAVLSLMVMTLAACSQDSKAPPVSTDSVGAASQMPQSPNSLPLGSAVGSPLDPVQGNIGTTRVGPSRPAVPGVR